MMVLMSATERVSDIRRRAPSWPLARSAVALITLGLCLLMCSTGVAAAQPLVASFTVTPRVLPSNGGEFTITANVRAALSCTIYYPGLGAPRTVNCSSGHIAYRRHAPANDGTVPALWLVHIEAHSASGNTRSRDGEVEVPPTSAPPPPVKGLDACTGGPECDYGAAYASLENWGNVAPDALGDCTFAAAANWEQIVLRVHADPTVLGFEFAQAGGTEAGLAQNKFWSYWKKDGIAGVYLTRLNPYTTGQEDVENAVRDYGALVAELSFEAEDGFDEYTIATASTHDVVVDGFTPEGPLVATWGETVQMTWEQWNDEVLGMWGIATSTT
jgi:hypothetical protein